MSKTDKYIIGQGSYGCVFNPALDCEDGKKFDIVYNISKVQSKTDTNNETKEYKNIDKFDPYFKYHLKHESCTPEKNEINNIKKCELFSKETETNVKNLKLIQMPYGGIPIKDLLKSLSDEKKKLRNIGTRIFKSVLNFTLYYEKENEEKLFGTRFFNSFINLFEGIQLFNKNGFMHFDIKSDNILYNIDEGKSLFIDFGLSTMKDEIKLESERVLRFGHESILWGYYPLDTFFYNENEFDYCKNLITKNNTETSIRIIRHRITANLSGKRFTIFKLYFKDKYTEFYNAYLSNFIKTFIDFINSGSKTYEDYMNICTGKLDIYSFGLVLKDSIDVFYYLGYFNKKKTESYKCYNDLINLVDKMTTYDFVERLTPEKALAEYKKILYNPYMNYTRTPTTTKRIKTTSKTSSNRKKIGGRSQRKFTRTNRK